MRLAAALLVVLCGCAEESPCASAVTKGPWVPRADSTSATIRWEAAGPGCVEAVFSVENGGAERVVRGTSVETLVEDEYGLGLTPMPDRAGKFHIAEVKLDGLAPSTCHAYRVRGSGTEAQKAGVYQGRFCTARRAGEPFKFVAFGDTNPIFRMTEKLNAQAAAWRPDFVLHLGDIQYYSSVLETWATWFGLMATLLRAGAFFPAIGNHESETPTELADYYERLFTREKYYAFTWGDLGFIAIDSEESGLDEGSPQVVWLDATLASLQTRANVVYFHRPILTLGSETPKEEWRARFEPRFVQHRVALVLQGHMHGYERFEVPGAPTYLTCAGGGGLIDDVNENVPNYPELAKLRVAVADVPDVCLLEWDGATLRGRAVAVDGTILDQWERAVP